MWLYTATHKQYSYRKIHAIIYDCMITFMNNTRPLWQMWWLTRFSIHPSTYRLLWIRIIDFKVSFCRTECTVPFSSIDLCNKPSLFNSRYGLRDPTHFRVLNAIEFGKSIPVHFYFEMHFTAESNCLLVCIT